MDSQKEQKMLKLKGLFEINHKGDKGWETNDKQTNFQMISNFLWG